MQKAFTYRDDKTDKFWRIEQLDAEFAVNYGKTGVTGKYEIKEFDSGEACLKQAAKLIAQKIKKGYVETSSFDYINHWYFDDNEIGLHPLTSHPYFREHFTAEFYYDCCDEEAPFGSDEGADTLYIMTEKLRKKPSFAFADFPEYIIEQEWDMRYLPVDSLDRDVVGAALEADEMNLIQSNMITYAAAFGQVKITGRLDKSLCERAVLALQRQQLVAEIQEWGPRSAIMDGMIQDLLSFKHFIVFRV